jgi:hypothetical protein
MSHTANTHTHTLYMAKAMLATGKPNMMKMLRKSGELLGKRSSSRTLQTAMTTPRPSDTCKRETDREREREKTESENNPSATVEMGTYAYQVQDRLGDVVAGEEVRLDAGKDLARRGSTSVAYSEDER